MRSSSGSERSPAAILATLPPAAQIVLQESDDEDDDPVLVSSTQAATNAGIPPVITEPPPGSQAPQLPESQASDLDSDEFEVEVILNHRFSGTKKKVSARRGLVPRRSTHLPVLSPQRNSMSSGKGTRTRRTPGNQKATSTKH